MLYKSKTLRSTNGISLTEASIPPQPHPDGNTIMQSLLPSEAQIQCLLAPTFDAWSKIQRQDP